jgi:hypothetical protein
MKNEDVVDVIRRKYQILSPVLDERSRRVWAAAEAASLGYGGQSLVAVATGISRTTIYNELKKQHADGPKPCDICRLRSPGGGRKSLIDLDTGLLSALERLVEPTTRGDPESPLRWTCKSTRQLADALQAQGYKIERQTVATLLDKLEYSLQGNQKTKEGSSSPDRDAQFKYINSSVLDFQKRKQPVISVDTKKKELVGNFKNNGKEWNPQGEPDQVNVHDFMDKKLGKVNPYGVYDQTANVGWVSVGIDHDTSDFAVETIRRWWEKMGKPHYQDATDLLITADGGGSNGSRVRLWKVALQRFADQTRLRIFVCHFPPGTSKWNKIEHRMFSHISMNWRGKPLISHDVIVNLIANTTTRKGLKIEAELDMNSYQTGIKVTDEEMKKLQIERSKFHGEWNYTIVPK